jgi:Flp pilus assembly pilin Flp
MKLFSLLERGLLVANDARGQEYVEYALMGGFVALMAGAVLPEVTGNASVIFGNITSMMTVLAQTQTLPISFGH